MYCTSSCSIFSLHERILPVPSDLLLNNHCLFSANLDGEGVKIKRKQERRKKNPLMLLTSKNQLGISLLSKHLTVGQRSTKNTYYSMTTCRGHPPSCTDRAC